MIKIENMEYEQEIKLEDSDVRFENHNIKCSPSKERQDYWSYEKNINSTKLKPDLIVDKTKPVMERVNTTKKYAKLRELNFGRVWIAEKIFRFPNRLGVLPL